MNRRTLAPQKRNLTVIEGILVLIGTLLIIQTWLLTAALESFLAGHREGAAPAAIISGLIFLGCAGLYFFVERLDAETRDLPSARDPVERFRMPAEHARSEHYTSEGDPGRLSPPAAARGGRCSGGPIDQSTGLRTTYKANRAGRCEQGVGCRPGQCKATLKRLALPRALYGGPIHAGITARHIHFEFFGPHAAVTGSGRRR